MQIIKPFYVGCAGWTAPAADTDNGNGKNGITGRPIIAGQTEAPKEKRKSHLECYTAFFSAVEINSSFYRPHLPKTYAKWRKTVSPDFRFSVKFPRAITHDLRLRNCNDQVQKFLKEVSNLEETLGCLLIQLPPSLGFNASIADDFFALVQNRSTVPLALEPRHPSWFVSDMFRLLERRDIALVHADPRPTGLFMDNFPHTASTIYYRLHGSPAIYYSSYDQRYLENLLSNIIDQSKKNRPIWCIFDNTASGAAFPNALTMRAMWKQALSESSTV